MIDFSAAESYFTAETPSATECAEKGSRAGRVRSGPSLPIRAILNRRSHISLCGGRSSGLRGSAKASAETKTQTIRTNGKNNARIPPIISVRSVGRLTNTGGVVSFSTEDIGIGGLGVGGLGSVVLSGT